MNIRRVDRSYCSQSDVERAMGVSAAETNVTQTQIIESIKSASNEVDLITHTTYHSIEDDGTASSGTTTSLTDSTQSWTVDGWTNYVVWIYAGTGVGQYAAITSNTSDTLSFATVTTAPDATSKYRIIPDCVITQSYNGDDTNTLFLSYRPIKNLQSLSISGVTVTPSKVYKWEDEGYLELHGQLNPEATYFTRQYPQNVVVSWVYGVYPVPADVKRLVASIAAQQCLIEQIGGTYNDVTNYSIPHLSASKGEPYMNIRATIDYLKKEIDMLLKRIVKYSIMA